MADPGFLAVFIGSQLTTLAVATPFVGAMSRLRANYSPISITVGDKTKKKKDGVDLGLLDMLQRTWDLEGVWGIFKGAYASTISSLIISAGSALVWFLNPFPVIDSEAGVVANIVGQLPLSPNAALLAGLLGTLGTGIVLLPFSIMTSRAIITPYRLPFDVSSLRALTSPSERREPWRLYTAPGLIANYVLQTLSPIAVSAITMPLIYGVSVAATPEARAQGALGPEYFGTAFVIMQVAAAAWMVPLSVLAEKISVAPDYDDDVDGPLAVAKAEAEGKQLESEFGLISNNEVVRRRNAPRYKGLRDAWSTVKREEGIGALYRGWIWTVIALAGPAIGQVLAAAQMGAEAGYPTP